MKQEKDIWIETVMSKRNEICYTPESIRHPAKMELNMCRKIIKLYSKKGDTVLDPMVGIGSTIIEGMILGRNVIGIEYEQKFVDLTQKNIDRTNKNCSFMKSLGKGKVIKGDSRKLSELLNSQADSILFSQPFANANEGKGIAKRMVENKKDHRDTYGGTNQAQPLSKDKNNIDNMKDYGKIDTIITSQPYEDSEAGMNKCKFKNPEEFARISAQRYKTGEKKGHSASKEAIFKSMSDHAIGYNSDKNNLGNKKGKNYLTEMLKIYQQCYLVLKKQGFMVLVIKNFVRKGEQIRLDLDTIKLCEKAGFKHLKRHYRLIKNPSFWITNAIQKWEKKHPGKQHPYPLEEDILVFRKEE